MCMKDELPIRRSGNVPVTLEQAEFEYALVLRRVQFSVTEAFTLFQVSAVSEFGNADLLAPFEFDGLKT